MLTAKQLDDMDARWGAVFTDFSDQKQTEAIAMARADMPAVLETVKHHTLVSRQLIGIVAWLLEQQPGKTVEIPDTAMNKDKTLATDKTVRFEKTPSGIKASLHKPHDFMGPTPTATTPIKVE